MFLCSVRVMVVLFCTNTLSVLKGCGVKTPPSPLLPSAESPLDTESRTRKKEREKAIRK